MFFRTLSKWPLKISKNAEFAQPFRVTSSSISVIVRREFSLRLFGIHHFAAFDSLVLFLNFSSFLFCGETCLVSLIMFHIQIFLFEKKKKAPAQTRGVMFKSKYRGCMCSDPSNWSFGVSVDFCPSSRVCSGEFDCKRSSGIIKWYQNMRIK